MPILTFPSILPDSVEWVLVSNTANHVSPSNRATQTLELPGTRWAATLRLQDRKKDDERELMAFLAELRGAAGRFYLYDHSHPNPRGTPAGTPLVDGASQTGKTLNTKGWTPSATGLLKKGDYIGFNNELRMVMDDSVDADVGGLAAITLDAPIRVSPANNDPIVTDKPKAVMRLVDDNQAKLSARNQRYSSFVISCVESFV